MSFIEGDKNYNLTQDRCPDCEAKPGWEHLVNCSLVPILPDTNPKTRYGVQKTPFHLLPPPALTAMAGVMGLGAKKYGPYNWREHAVSASVYQAAAFRHLMAWWEGEDRDAESGENHLAHVMACMAIILDAKDKGKLNDDRP